MILWRAATGRNRLNDPEARRNRLSLKMKFAEAAVLDGIAELALGQLSGGSLILKSTKAAVQRRADLEDQSEPLLPMLRLELRRLFLLVPKNRDCFVLRVLIGLTPELCSEMLNVPTSEVEDALYTALREPPRGERTPMDRTCSFISGVIDLTRHNRRS
jgi:DNA-directed RNA polymerase specialized sigma24 family protein